MPLVLVVELPFSLYGSYPCIICFDGLMTDDKRAS
jgi:hypothetical protein